MASADAAVARGDRNGAAGMYMSLARSRPDWPQPHLGLAFLYLDSGRHNEGRDLILRALRLPIDSPRSAILLAEGLVAISESALLIDVAKQIPDVAWDSAKSLAEFAQQLMLVGANDVADRLADLALARDPAHPPSRYLKATLDIFFGRLDAAAENADACLERIPDDPGAHWLKSRLRLSGAEDRAPRLEALLAAAKDDDTRAWLGYALHGERHDLKQYEASWRALSAACAAKRATLRYDVATNRALFDALHRIDAAEIRGARGWSDPVLTPIFVIGMHRSGTTLAERVISGHPDVAAGGETYDFTAALRRASGLHFRGECHEHAVVHRGDYDDARIGQEYTAGVAWRAAGKPFITDKLPSNFVNVGLIAKALPNARFIHLRRDPMDVAFSNLRTMFSEACPYSYDIDEFAEYHGRYLRLMDHWRSVLPPGRLLDVDYQSIVDTPEATAEHVASFLGLAYHPAMVDIGSRGDAVATASSVMMRDGIRKDRGALWKNYATWMAPLARALGPSSGSR